MPLKNATLEEINVIEKIILNREHIVETSNGDFLSCRVRLNELDSEFHMAVSKASGNSVIYEFISAISDIFRIHQNKAAEKYTSPVISNTFHRKIFNAIKG